MNASQVYEQTVKPLSSQEKLALARMIINEFESEFPAPGKGFDYLKRILPQIERITLTDEDLAKVSLKGPLPE